VALVGVGCGDAQVPDAPAPAAAPPRDLVLITMDTTRADALTPYGQVLPSSPNIARMAAEGVLFEQASTSVPSTLPSHASILTGRYPFEHGVRANAGYRLPEASTTLAEVLRSRGYRTAAEIAAPVLEAAMGLSQGFEQYRDLHAAGIQRIVTQSDAPGNPEVKLDERPAADITRGALRFLDAHRDEPFFLWLHYFDPHVFHVHRAEYQRKIPGDDYLAEVLYTDVQIGVLLDHLEATGLRDHTLVVLVADHGEGRGEHGESTHSFLVYESTIRVPFLLWGPRELPAGRRVPSLVRTIDVLPTALDWLGVPIPAGVTGQSLMPLVLGQRDDLELAAYGESIEFATVFDAAPVRFLRRGRWKYVHHPEPELYDLMEDPGEQHNVASEHPERVAALRAELEALLAGASGTDAGVSEITPEQRARLVALGYSVPTDGAAEAAELNGLEWRGPPPAQLMADVDLSGKALSLLRVGRAQEAERILAELVARYPHNATQQRDHAQALLALGRKEEARAALERAVELSRCAATERVTLSQLLAEMGEQEARQQVLAEGIERCGEIPELLNNDAWVLATSPAESLRNGERAEALARRALAAGGAEVPEILDTLAAAQAERGDFAGAADTLRRAIKVARDLGRPPVVEQMLARSLERVRSGQPIREE